MKIVDGVLVGELQTVNVDYAVDDIDAQGNVQLNDLGQPRQIKKTEEVTFYADEADEQLDRSIIRKRRISKFVAALFSIGLGIMVASFVILAGVFSGLPLLIISALTFVSVALINYRLGKNSIFKFLTEWRDLFDFTKRDEETNKKIEGEKLSNLRLRMFLMVLALVCAPGVGLTVAGILFVGVFTVIGTFGVFAALAPFAFWIAAVFAAVAFLTVSANCFKIMAEFIKMPEPLKWIKGQGKNLWAYIKNESEQNTRSKLLKGFFTLCKILLAVAIIGLTGYGLIVGVLGCVAPVAAMLVVMKFIIPAIIANSPFYNPGVLATVAVLGTGLVGQVVFTIKGTYDLLKGVFFSNSDRKPGDSSAPKSEFLQNLNKQIETKKNALSDLRNAREKNKVDIAIGGFSLAGSYLLMAGWYTAGAINALASGALSYLFGHSVTAFAGGALSSAPFPVAALKYGDTPAILTDAEKRLAINDARPDFVKQAQASALYDSSGASLARLGDVDSITTASALAALNDKRNVARPTEVRVDQAPMFSAKPAKLTDAQKASGHGGHDSQEPS